MFIYKVTNKANNKCYIGQTIQKPSKRLSEHCSNAKKSSTSFYFHNALKKHGIDNFDFQILHEANNLEELNSLEEYYINLFDSINEGYNLRKGGGNKLHSESSKKLMSESQKNAHARRRKLNNGIEKHKTPSHKGKRNLWQWSEKRHLNHKEYGEKIYKHTRGKTWKVINGKRVWMDKE